jgi:hypothetical protein
MIEKDEAKASEGHDKDQLYQSLKSTDLELARVTEDLISLLVKKNTILFTELPEVVQEKLLAREQLRDRLNGELVSLISEGETL